MKEWSSKYKLPGQVLIKNSQEKKKVKLTHWDPEAFPPEKKKCGPQEAQEKDPFKEHSNTIILFFIFHLNFTDIYTSVIC